MATIDQYLSPVDIRDAHTLTLVVERTVRESEVWNIPFAPIRTVNNRLVKLRIKNVDGAGLASFKADNAVTPIISGQGDVTDVWMELFLIAEKDVIKTSDLVRLNSADELVARSVASDIAQKAVFLRRRNMNRTKWMVWQAVRDELSVSYPDGAQIAIDYDLNASGLNSWFGATHLMSAETGWGNITTADPIEDLHDWTYRISEDLGVAQEQCIVYMSSAVARFLRQNSKVRAELSSSQPRIITPTMTEIPEILGVSAIRVYNDFYVAEDTSTKTKYLPDTHVLVTGPDTVNGEAIMEVLDGPVARVVGDDIVVAPNGGALSEIYIDKEAVTKNVRVQTSRHVQMNYPAAFVWADIR